MLRLILVLLLLANGLYFAWSHRYLAMLGWAPAQQSEPARMLAQIKPEAVRLLGSAEARRSEAAATATPPAAAPEPTPAAAVTLKLVECLQSAVLDDAIATRVRSAASGLPGGSWMLEPVAVPARWIIYMGKYPNADALTKKKTELRELDVRYEVLQNTSLEPGISLGGHETQALANQALVSLNKRGVRTAKVVQEKAASQKQLLRLPAVDDALRARLDPVKAALGNASLRTCSS
ncbi:MAG: SPOR domain-containing protein [Burkholderiaceae bacterium]